MISLKMGLIMAAMFAAGSFLAPPVQQAIAAVIATDVQCTGCVGTSDLAGSTVTSAKIKDGEVKAADIATDAVGAAEIQGVTKLLFGQCAPTSSEATTPVTAGGLITIQCSISGVDSDDSAVATLNGGAICFSATQAVPAANAVYVDLYNRCGSTQSLTSGADISVMVYDK